MDASALMGGRAGTGPGASPSDNNRLFGAIAPGDQLRCNTSFRNASKKKTMIEVENLSKYYGSFQALDSISFSVREGEVAGFVGLNGAGKSTTMRILCGFMPFQQGTVSVGSCNVSTDSLGARRLIGYLPEGVPLYPDMRVTEFLTYRAALKNLYGPERRRAVSRVLSSSHIADVQKRIIGHLSRGYRQRVAIADALLVDPPCLIMDEPTLGLDPIQVKQLRTLLKEIGGERTIIFSTHILSEVDVVCDSIIIIHEGRIIARGTVEEIKRQAKKQSGGALQDPDLEEAFVQLVEKESGTNVA